MRAHRGTARARQAAHDLGLYRRVVRLQPPIDWIEVRRLATEQGTLRLSRPWLEEVGDRTARAVSRGRRKASVGNPTP